MFKSLITAFAVAILAITVTPAVSEPSRCSNAPKNYMPCPHTHVGAQPSVSGGG
jgi:hypothetical protein